MIIEFAGIPGSGKSSLADAFRRELEARGQNVWLPEDYWRGMGLIQTDDYYRRIYGFIKKFIFIGGAVLLNIRTIRTIPWGNILFHTAFSHKKIILRSFATNLAEREILKRSLPKNTIAVLDEGIVHRVYSLFVLDKIPADMTRLIKYAKAIDLPDLLVYVRSSIPTCMDRMLKRGLPMRLNNMKRTEILSILTTGKKVLDAVVEKIQLERSQKVQFIDLESGDIAESTKNLLYCVECR